MQIDFGEYFRRMRGHLKRIRSFRLPDGLVMWSRAISLLYGLLVELAPGVRPLDVLGPFVAEFLQGGPPAALEYRRFPRVEFRVVSRSDGAAPARRAPGLGPSESPSRARARCRRAEMQSIRSERVIGFAAAAAVAGLIAAVPAPDALAAEQKSTRNEAEWVKYDAAAKTVKLKIKKLGLGPGAAKLKVGQESRLQRPARGSVLTRTSVAINGKKGALTDIPAGQDGDRLLGPGREGSQGALRPQDRRDPERSGARREVRQGGVGWRRRGSAALAVDVVELKQVLARRASGVAIVTARDGDVIHGMTVSAFTEVSLVPPLVLVCAEKSLEHAPGDRAGRRLRAQRARARPGRALRPLRLEAGRGAALRRARVRNRRDRRAAARGTVATLDCRVRAAHDAGDHVIYVGEVVDLRRSEREPLVYWRGAYRGLDRGLQ